MPAKLNTPRLFIAVLLSGFLFSVSGWTNTSDSSVSPETALQMLQEGNARFVTGNRIFPNMDIDRIHEVASGQFPFATVITCSDSRVSPEHLFDRGLGDIFTIRVAGNVCDIDEIGSIEYGVDHLGTPVLVVLGHSSCGAVTAVVTKAEVHGSIPSLVDNIIPAVKTAELNHPELHGNDLVAPAVEANVWQSIQDLLKQSEATRKRYESGKLKIIGAVYQLEDGRVDWLGEYPGKDNLRGKFKINSSIKNDENASSLPAIQNAKDAMATLKEGNARFVQNNRIYPNQNSTRIQDIANGQHPFVTLITCSDSRVPPEHLFDLGLGDVFVIRVAGNVCDIDEIGSIEYGVDHLGTPLLIVLGHTSCGAVTAVVTEAELHGSIPQLVDNIKPAVEKAQASNPNLHGKDLVPASVKANVWQSISDLFQNSSATRNLVQEGKLEAVGAIYDLADGKIIWLGEHPSQNVLLDSFSNRANEHNH